MSQPELVEIKEQQYKDERSKAAFDRFHQRTRTHEPDFVYEIVRIVMSLMAWIFFRVARLPPRARAGRRAGDPRAESLLVPGSLLPRRGAAAQGPLHGQVAALQAADGVGLHARRRLPGAARRSPTRTRSSPPSTVLDRGDTMAMYAEGGRSRTGELAKKPRRGIGRLALLSGAPIVPVAIVGSSHVRNWKRGQFPKVRVLLRRAVRLRARGGADARAGAGRRRRDLRQGPRALRRGDQPAPALPEAADARPCRARAARPARPRRAPPRRPRPPARHPVGEGLRRRVGAVGGEHRGQHGDAERPAELADRVRRARGLAGLLPGARTLSTALAVGAKTSAIPAPASMNGITNVAVGRVGRGDRRRASRSRPPAARARRTSAGASRSGRESRPAIGATNIGMPVHGSVRRPASSGE